MGADRLVWAAGALSTGVEVVVAYLRITWPDESRPPEPQTSMTAGAAPLTPGCYPTLRPVTSGGRNPDGIAIGLLGGCVSPAVKEVAADVRRKPAAKFEGWENEWPRE
jgi:hypothetical protein